MPDLYVASSPRHGRGVFAGRPFAAGEVVEVCPVLVVPSDQRWHLDQTSLWGYYFEWLDDAGAVALGFGSLYNHSWEPNAAYEQDYDAVAVRVYAVRDIAAGEEVTINYTGDPEGRDELWFVPHEAAPSG